MAARDAVKCVPMITRNHCPTSAKCAAALAQAGIEPLIALSLPGFLGLPSVLANSDLIATLPRHIGMALATQTALTVAHCPIPVPGFQVKLHWHARQHADPANAWLRDTAASALAHAG